MSTLSPEVELALMQQEVRFRDSLQAVQKSNTETLDAMQKMLLASKQKIESDGERMIDLRRSVDKLHETVLGNGRDGVQRSVDNNGREIKGMKESFDRLEDKMDAQFDGLHKDVSERFDKIDTKHDALDKRIKVTEGTVRDVATMKWVVRTAVGAAIVLLVGGILKVLGFY